MAPGYRGLLFVPLACRDEPRAPGLARSRTLCPCPTVPVCSALACVRSPMPAVDVRVGSSSAAGRFSEASALYASDDTAGTIHMKGWAVCHVATALGRDPGGTAAHCACEQSDLSPSLTAPLAPSHLGYEHRPLTCGARRTASLHT